VEVWGTEVPQWGRGAEPWWGTGGEASRSWRQMLISSYDGGHAPMFPSWLRHCWSCLKVMLMHSNSIVQNNTGRPSIIYNGAVVRNLLLLLVLLC